MNHVASVLCLGGVRYAGGYITPGLLKRCVIKVDDVSHEGSMTTNAQIGGVVFVHGANSARYEQVLESHLTPEECNCVERRLSEEQMALARLISANS